MPLVDTIAVGGLQLQMLRRLSQIYGVAFSENSGKALIASTAGSMIPATSGIGAASVLKAVPIFGTIVSGFVMPVLSAGATYAIGKAFIQHFATGGTLLDFNPPDYREFIKAQKEMWDSRKSGSNGLLNRPRGRQRPALNSLGGMPANPGVVPPAEARQPWTGETEPHARTHRLHNSVRSHGTLRQPTPNGFFRDIYPRDYHHSVRGAACAAAHRPITSRRMAPPFVEQPFHWGPQAHPSLSRRRRLVQA